MSSTFLPAKPQACLIGCGFHFSVYCLCGGARQDFFRVWIVIPSALGLCGPHLDWRLAGKPWVSATVASWALSGDLTCLMPEHNAADPPITLGRHEIGSSTLDQRKRVVRSGERAPTSPGTGLGSTAKDDTHISWSLQVGWWLPPRNRVCMCQEPGCMRQECPSPGAH